MSAPNSSPKPEGAAARDERDVLPPLDAAASLHQAVQQQIAEVLASSGLSEDEKQQILVAMQCPCCGAGGLSLSIKLGPPRGTPSF